MPRCRYPRVSFLRRQHEATRATSSRACRYFRDSIQQFAEWVCPDCDYFQEADEEAESR